MYKFSNKEHTAVTNLETGASGIHPGVWMWQSYQDWLAKGNTTQPYKTTKQLRDERLFSELQQVDQDVIRKQSQPFQFNGHNYYPDTEFIQGIFSALPVLPDNYTEIWKTADKDADEINNVYVTLDKAGIAGLAIAYLSFRKRIWSEGEAQKSIIKKQYLEPLVPNKLMEKTLDVE